jgi:hypothetical protein
MRIRSDNVIKTVIRKVKYNRENFISVSHDRDEWWPLVTAVVNVTERD